MFRASHTRRFLRPSRLGSRALVPLAALSLCVASLPASCADGGTQGDEDSEVRSEVGTTQDAQPATSDALVNGKDVVEAVDVWPDRLAVAADVSPGRGDAMPDVPPVLADALADSTSDGADMLADGSPGAVDVEDTTRDLWPDVTVHGDSDSPAGYSVVAEPETGWTRVWETVDCECDGSNPSCHAIYQGRVESVDGNRAALSFRKSSEAPPSVDSHYLIAVTEERQPSCASLPYVAVRVQGVWSSDVSVLRVEDVPVWPDDDGLASAPCGERKNLFLITGGGDDPGAETRTWFQQTALSFTKRCAEDCRTGCAGKECGSDGCGGSCGYCSGARECRDGRCEAAATPPFLLGIAEPLAWNTLGSKRWPLDQQLAVLEPFSPRIVRLWFSAGHLQTGPGTEDGERLVVYEEAVARLEEAGYLVVGMDHGLPEWMTGVSTDLIAGDPVPCRDTTSGSSYLLFLDRFEEAWRWKAEHFSEIEYWETGNEPNGDPFLHPTTECDADGLFTLDEKIAVTVDMMYRAYRGVKAGNPDAFVFMPGLSPANDVAFLEGLYDRIASGEAPSADPREYFDGATWHPYIAQDPTAGEWLAHNTALHDVLVAHGDGDIPVLLSEFGFTDGGDGSLWDRHADWLLGSFRVAATDMPWLWGITWFRLFDDPSLQRANVYESGFGVVTAPPDDSEWKPIGFALESLANGQAPTEDTLLSLEFGTPGDVEGVSGEGVSALRSVGGWLWGHCTEGTASLTLSEHSVASVQAVEIRMASWDWSEVEVKVRLERDAAVTTPVSLVSDGRPRVYVVRLDGAVPADDVVNSLSIEFEGAGRFVIDHLRLMR